MTTLPEKVEHPKGHVWSGWPGAVCLKCGAEQALENAIGMGWVEIMPEANQPDKWKSDTHKRLVELCDGHCPADMTPEQRDKYRKVMEAGDAAVKAIDPEYGRPRN